MDGDLFEEWANTEGRRRANYEEPKRIIEERLLAQLRRRLPELMEHLAYFELSTPLTTKEFTRASQGTIYGLEATPERFTCKALRTRTHVKNFYMTGIDVVSLGVVGAMTTGMLTAASIEAKLYGRLALPEMGMKLIRRGK